ncbi:MAG: 50S ribosomal protein L2 [Candidatus Aenigmarchaeota archaeon]|nr:50S ribosomal protein L2 [Candidatus Aenigmarchaeota archaeon]
MGKNLIQQRRGKGTPRYRSPGHRFIGKVSYQFLPKEVKEGIVLDIVDAPGRTTPVAVVDFGGQKFLQIAHEGMFVGQPVDFSEAKEGNILPLKEIPEGSKIYNIELVPGDGGRLCRSSGTFAVLTSREGKKAVVLLPSKEKKTLSAQCRATVGTAASAGRLEKPFMKAGSKFYAMRALNKLWPRSRGVAMNAVDHPFGGQTRPGKVKSVSRHMPPGKKVGSISPRRMGKKKRKA